MRVSQGRGQLGLELTATAEPCPGAHFSTQLKLQLSVLVASPSVAKNGLHLELPSVSPGNAKLVPEPKGRLAQLLSSPKQAEEGAELPPDSRLMVVQIVDGGAGAAEIELHFRDDSNQNVCMGGRLQRAHCKSHTVHVRLTEVNRESPNVPGGSAGLTLSTVGSIIWLTVGGCRGPLCQ